MKIKLFRKYIGAKHEADLKYYAHISSLDSHLISVRYIVGDHHIDSPLFGCRPDTLRERLNAAMRSLKDAGLSSKEWQQFALF
ncbi:MAG: hypothetical protein RJQ09_21320 [Cyclobacteriaceae bacterium]